MDNVFVTVHVSVQYQAIREKVYSAFYSLQDLQQQMRFVWCRRCCTLSRKFWSLGDKLAFRIVCTCHLKILCVWTWVCC
jgi:hypothetical protein